ncbi:ArdC-like ssDNA-binding domain-containing protein (plasmid) [Sphingobium sp. SJ10-10]|uniref:ArdC family protein n=1 Tax=Sphingobium sp. SJ10-10 TaxID=3114999 RepID=UPI002E18B608|nr:ArdC-like ssDNA-binding domain-containing protein [Sphingobium sp. SJ10-10]
MLVRDRLYEIRRMTVVKTTDKPSPADTITNAIINKLEAGVRPWVKPWRPGLGGRPLRATGDPYKGINCFWLWLCAEGAGYHSRTWMTYKQAQALGGQVREGERSQIAIFYKSYSKTVESPVTGDPTDEMRRVLRSYAVFNADQIEGLPEKFYPSPLSVVAPDDELPDRAERFLDALPARVFQCGDRAFYDRVADSITMPPVALFSTRAYFASTLAHEAGHWTGHPDRLNREFGRKFGDNAYAFEELCALSGQSAPLATLQ